MPRFLRVSPVIAVLIALLFPLAVSAQSDERTAMPASQPSVLKAGSTDYEAVEREVVRAINKPNINIAFTRPSKALPGFLEMQVEFGPLLLVNPTSKQVIDGTLLDYSTGRLVNLSEKANRDLRRTELPKVPLEDMIIYPAGQEKKFHIYVFTDVDCGYCRKIHEEVPELNARGVEVRYLAFPRAGLNSATYNKMQTAWCSDDKRKTLTMLKAGQSVEPKYCENPIADQYRLGGIMGIRATPAIITEQGDILPGYMPADRLIMTLEKLKYSN